MPLARHALFEDGTVNYLGIPAVEIGLRHIERIGIDAIVLRVEALGSWLLEGAALLDSVGDAGSIAIRVLSVSGFAWSERCRPTCPVGSRAGGGLTSRVFVDRLV